MGREMNGKFYRIPYSRIIKKLRETLNNHGIELVKTEESYTSKCDAVNLEEICSHSKYYGVRKGRGFKTKTGRYINADVNGAINIMRKVINLTKIKGVIYNPIQRHW